MRRVVVAAALVAAFLVVIPALATDVVSVDIPIGTLHGDEGELILVGTVDTGPGLLCTGAVDPVNNTSDHDDTDVVFESGQAGGMIFDVEVPTFDPSQTISFVTEGPTLIYFRVGPDKVISAGFVAMLDCHEPEDTTTTTVAVTTTVPDTTTTTHVDPPPTTVTTITAPPPGCPQDPTTPCGPVDAGGGAMAAILLDPGANGGMIMGGGILLALALLIGGVGLAMKRNKD